MTAGPMRPACGSPGAPRGMPMSITCTRPAWALPGWIHSPGLPRRATCEPARAAAGPEHNERQRTVATCGGGVEEAPPVIWAWAVPVAGTTPARPNPRYAVVASTACPSTAMRGN
jgi:hypothetical protein